MRTVTETYKVYKYTELSEEAKEKVRQWYIDDDIRGYEFSDMLKDNLEYLFPNSDLKVQYSLNYCQGDGLNIYGDLNLEDVFNVINGKISWGEVFKEFLGYLTEKEQKTIRAYMDFFGQEVKLPRNDSIYSYCVAEHTDFAEEWSWELENYPYKNINFDAIKKTEGLVASMFSRLSYEWEDTGYKFFYEPDEDEIIECCEANEYEFFESGAFYG